MSIATADIGRGFAQPVHNAQQVFRAVLDAMARPGRLQGLPPATRNGFDSAGLGRGLCAVLLALLDAETSLWLDTALADGATAAHLRFHTGVRLVAEPARAAFVACAAEAVDPALWAGLEHGGDSSPQDGATLLVEVASLNRGTALELRGPGIEQMQTLHVDGLSSAFWHARIAAEAAFPCGVDLILCSGDQIAALPRSTRLHLQD